MRIRLVLGAVLVCALMATDAVAPAGAAPKRVFKGKTTQRHRVKLAAGGNHLKLLHFKARLRCRNGDALIVDESGFQRTPLRRGRFRDVQVGSTDTVFFRGHMTRRAIRGRLRVKDRLGNGVRCASRWIRFSARA